MLQEDGGWAPCILASNMAAEGFLGGSAVKNPPAMQKGRRQHEFDPWEDPLEEARQPSRILALEAHG